MANHETEIYELGQIQLYFPKKIEDLSDSDRSEALRLFSIGAGYYNQFFRKDAGHKVTASSFQKEVSPGEIQQIIDYLSKPEPEEPQVKKTKTPEKEDSTVPTETIAALIKELEADKLKADKLEADNTHSIADAVKRARKTWKTRHRAEIIRENRLALITDETERKRQTEIENLKNDQFFVESIDSKAESAAIIYKNTYRLAQQAIIAQAANLGIGLTPSQIHRAVEDLTYLGVTGAVDFTNFHDLNIVSQLAFVNQGITITSPLNQVDIVVQAWQKAEEIEPFSDKAEELEKQIIFADQEAEAKLRESVSKFEEELKKKYLDPKDLYEDSTKAQAELQSIQAKLLKAIPNAKLPPPPFTPLQLHENELESILRKEDPTKLSLSISPEGLGARTVATLETTNSGNRNISPEAVRLLSLGLTPEKLESLRNDPNSQLNKFIAGNQYGLSVYQQVHFQLNKIVGPNSDSKLGQDISANIKALSPDVISQTTKIIPEPVRKLGQDITNKVITKPFGGISKSITNFYNRQSPLVQSATKFILNPKGTLYAWVNKKIGQHAGNIILKYAGSATSKKLGNFILKEGLKEGAKKFIDAVAKKLIVETAKQAGVQGAKMAGMVAAESAIAAAAAALGISTFGLSLIVGAVLMVVTAVVDATIGLAKKGLDKVWQSMGWGEKFRSRDLILPVAAGGAVAITAGIAFVRGLIIIRRSVQIAVVSALGIIIGAGIVVGLYIAIAFLIAPILSTLVQFDSLEKVDYSQLSVNVKDCNSETLTNDKKTCQTSEGREYCFPVNDLSTVNYAVAHHDYYAADIFRNGDVAGPVDDVPLPILAYVGGTVSWISENNSLGGYAIEISGQDGRFYYYAHNMCNLVSLNQTVNAGDVIAGMDSSGDAINTPEHVHFQISDQYDMATIPENYPHFLAPWEDFCTRLSLCGPHVGN